MSSPARRVRWKRRGRIGATSLALVAVGIQLIRPERPQGELPGDGKMNDLVEVPAPDDSLLRRSCYDCHSGETRWPFYAHVAPLSWLLAHDVRHARSNLDFSRWSLDPTREPTPRQRFQWMCRDVRRGIMPPRLYLVAHPGARLTADEANLLCAWAEQRAVGAAVEPPAPSASHRSPWESCAGLRRSARKANTPMLAMRIARRSPKRRLVVVSVRSAEMTDLPRDRCGELGSELSLRHFAELPG